MRCPKCRYCWSTPESDWSDTDSESDVPRRWSKTESNAKSDAPTECPGLPCELWERILTDVDLQGLSRASCVSTLLRQAAGTVLPTRRAAIAHEMYRLWCDILYGIQMADWDDYEPLKATVKFWEVFSCVAPDGKVTWNSDENNALARINDRVTVDLELNKSSFHHKTPNVEVTIGLKPGVFHNPRATVTLSLSMFEKAIWTVDGQYVGQGPFEPHQDRYRDFTTRPEPVQPPEPLDDSTIEAANDCTLGLEWAEARVRVMKYNRMHENYTRHREDQDTLESHCIVKLFQEAQARVIRELSVCHECGKTLTADPLSRRSHRTSTKKLYCSQSCAGPY